MSHSICLKGYFWFLIFSRVLSNGRSWGNSNLENSLGWCKANSLSALLHVFRSFSIKPLLQSIWRKLSSVRFFQMRYLFSKKSSHMTLLHSWYVSKWIPQGTRHLRVFENSMQCGAAYGNSDWTGLCRQVHQRFFFCRDNHSSLYIKAKPKSKWVLYASNLIQFMILNLKICCMDPCKNRIFNMLCACVHACEQKWKTV